MSESHKHTDTHTRMHYRGIFELTPGKTRTVFLNEIPVEGLTIKDVAQLKKQVREIMEDGLKRYATNF